MFVSSFRQTFVEKFADQTFSAVEKTFKNICVRCSHLSLKISSTISSYQFTLYRQDISRQKLEIDIPKFKSLTSRPTSTDSSKETLEKLWSAATGLPCQIGLEMQDMTGALPGLN